MNLKELKLYLLGSMIVITGCSDLQQKEFQKKLSNPFPLPLKRNDSKNNTTTDHQTHSFQPIDVPYVDGPYCLLCSRLPVCESSQDSQLTIIVNFAPGTELQPAKIRILSNNRDDKYTVPESNGLTLGEGTRRKDTQGKTAPFLTYQVLANPGVGPFFITITWAEKEIFAKFIETTHDGICNKIIPQTVKVDIKDSATPTLDESKDYYPLSEGKGLAVVDKQTGIGKLYPMGEEFKDFEVIRVLASTEMPSSPPTSPQIPSLKEERKPLGKILLGYFNEEGMERGPLPSHTADHGRRTLYAIPSTPP